MNANATANAIASSPHPASASTPVIPASAPALAVSFKHESTRIPTQVEAAVGTHVQPQHVSHALARVPQCGSPLHTVVVELLAPERTCASCPRGRKLRKFLFSAHAVEVVMASAVLTVDDLLLGVQTGVALPPWLTLRAMRSPCSTDRYALSDPHTISYPPLWLPSDPP